MGHNVVRPTDQFISLLLPDVTHLTAGETSSAMPQMPITVELPFMLAASEGIASARRSRSLARLDTLTKRLIDILVASVLLIATAPLFLVLAILVSLDGGSVFFGHWRVGRHLRPFRCFKIRTMIPNAETTLAEYLELNPDAALEWEQDNKLTFDVRITPIGRLLRETSLDELPQLWNVLRGDMSLVGPRPITSQESRRYGASLGCYASLRPGMTGLWQVSGRSEVGYEGRVALDAHYARQRSLGVDLAILFICTPKILLSRRGAR